MGSDPTPEMRRNDLTNEWIAYAPDRLDRPHRTSSGRETNADRESPPRNDTPVPGCPFCPGNEEQLPSVRWQLESDDGPWCTRAVPNKYAALERDAPRPSTPPTSLYASRASTGHQEVIIDTPNHHLPAHRFGQDQMRAVVHTYVQRYETARADGLIPVLFRNHGARAGASIDHPHSQLVALPFEPATVQREEMAARTWHEDRGACPYCTMIEIERGEECRVVTETDGYVMFVPYAAREPYELWILPRRHEPEFARTTNDERSALSRLLQDALSRLYRTLDNPSYNLFVRTALTYESSAPYLHWSLRIRPRVSVDAGLEQSTNVRINPSIPERDAAALRGA